ncbi:MAG: hypothetical protein RLZZ219_773 [Cyanobacteriota bacterium]|jgi:glutaredoxin
MRPAAPALRGWRLPLFTAFSLMALGGMIAAGRPTGVSAATQPGAAAGGLGEATSPSTPDQLALVEHLRRRGAVVYGAWWCPHCSHQKQLFGREAGERLPYVECDKDDPGRKRCSASGIRAYPTWDLNGQRREGVLTLEELRIWSGFPETSAVSPGKAVRGTAPAGR